MAQLKAIEKKIKTVRDIESVVSTMKTLAAVNINNFQSAADSARSYLSTVEKSLQVTLRNAGVYSAFSFGSHPGSKEGKKDDSKRIYLVIGSEQGMCGNFNEAVLSRLFKENTNPDVIAIGSKLNLHAEGRELSPVKEFSLPTSAEKLDDLVAEIQIELFQRIRKSDLQRVDIVSNRISRDEQIFETMLYTLYPISEVRLLELKNRQWDSRSLPTVLMDAEKLFKKGIDHYISGNLFLILINSLAGENAARLSSMQAAERNIRKKKDELYRSYNKVRQESITSELLDIVGGFEVLS